MTKFRLAIVVIVALFLEMAAAGPQQSIALAQEASATKTACTPLALGATIWFDSCLYLPAGNGVKVGRRVSGGEPQYSEFGRQNKIKGTVLLAVALNATGSVDAVKVVRSLEPSLDQKAVEAVQNWKFTPATKDGKPVAVQIEVSVGFNLY